MIVNNALVMKSSQNINVEMKLEWSTQNAFHCDICSNCQLIVMKMFPEVMINQALASIKIFLTTNMGVHIQDRKGTNDQTWRYCKNISRQRTFWVEAGDCIRCVLENGSHQRHFFSEFTVFKLLTLTATS